MDFSVGGWRGYNILKIEDGNTVISTGYLDEKETRGLCENIESALNQLGHQTEQEKIYEKALRDIADMAHGGSSGPTVADLLWEIREIAYNAL